MTLQPRDFMDRNVIDDVRLPGLKSRKARRIFCYFPEKNFFDIGLATPIIVVAAKNKISAPLIAHIFIRTGTNGMLVHLLAIFFRRRLAQNEAVLQAVQE